MLYLLLPQLSPYVGVLNVTRYITFRTAAASVTALALSFLFGPFVIRRLRDFKVGQIIRQEGPQSHHSKAGTPTMGGVLILGCVIVPTLLWADLLNPYVWIAVIATAGFGTVGFIDDYLKIIRRSHYGLLPRYKMAGLLIVSLFVGLSVLYLASKGQYNTRLIFPFFKNLIPDLGWFYAVFAVAVLLCSTNAVNLTDGLDGLAISTVAVASAAFTGLAYVTGHAVFASYLALVRFPPTGEVTIFCGALVGASLGFLWFNSYPAEVFMGDVGALALGAALGMVALIVRQEIVLLIMGGLFVVETLSVVIQVLSFKLTGKRVFRMAPIHHHFELKGWKENQVVVRFWIITMLLVLGGLSTLKLR